MILVMPILIVMVLSAYVDLVYYEMNKFENPNSIFALVYASLKMSIIGVFCIAVIVWIAEHWSEILHYSAAAIDFIEKIIDSFNNPPEEVVHFGPLYT